MRWQGLRGWAASLPRALTSHPPLQAADEARAGLEAEQARAVRLEVELAEARQALGRMQELERELQKHRCARLGACACRRRGRAALGGCCLQQQASCCNQRCLLTPTCTHPSCTASSPARRLSSKEGKGSGIWSYISGSTA